MKNYRKKNTQPMEPWTPGTNMESVSVSDADKNNGSPKAGDMIAVNPNDATDKWLIAQKFFKDNYEPVWDQPTCSVESEAGDGKKA